MSLQQPLEPAMSKNPRTEEKDQDELAEQPESSSRSPNQEEATLPKDRFLFLAQKLQEWYPEQDEELKWVIERESSKQQTIVGMVESEQGLIKSSPIPIPGKGHIRTASGGSTTSVANVHDQQEIDPRGRAWEPKDPLIHIFVDHSNILYGLPHLNSPTPLSPVITKATATATMTTRVDSVAAEAVSPTSTGSNALHNKTQGSLIAGSSPVQPLSCSAPSTSPLAGLISVSGVEDTDASRQKKKSSGRLWYAALALVLERGRPVTSRVVVASRRAYLNKPMAVETMARFGYEVRVLVMVPDIGVGLYRKQSKGKGGLSKDGQVKGISPSTSFESGGGRNVSASSSLDSNYGKTRVPGTPSNKVKEQGVDELLQLKIYQVITEPDDIPVGSTIVLATGDGGPGQFDERGFLRPIRKALRMGWKVELYTWEDSLSRAWEKEFGGKTEWREMFRIIKMNQFGRWLSFDRD